MTTLRSTIAAALLAGMALIAPAASQAAESPAVLISVVDPLDGDVVVEPVADLALPQPGEQLISLLGWGWGG